MFAYSGQPFATLIQFCGKHVFLVCDGRCLKAWGLDNRPTAQLSTDEDDIEWLADDELGDAPEDPGTIENADRKPLMGGPHNRWCARECERSRIVDVRDYSKRVKNMP
jgi:hypothetical protein